MDVDDLAVRHDRPVASPTCGLCRHLRDAGVRTCDAFPGGIPYAIWAGRHGHRSSVTGDGGITFERITADDQDRLARRQVASDAGAPVARS